VSAKWYEDGADPDYRFSLANERTFLAWVRTALAILGGAILLHQVQSNIRPGGISSLAGAGAAVVSGILGAAAYYRWRANEMAMRNAQSLPRTILLPFMSGLMVLIGAGTAVVLGGLYVVK
jgi:putative membrane protein